MGSTGSTFSRGVALPMVAHQGCSMLVSMTAEGEGCVLEVLQRLKLE
jgi:hypothetical protein